MFKIVKTYDSRVRDLVGSANCKRRGIAEVDTTYVDLYTVDVHNDNTDDIWFICTYSLHYENMPIQIYRKFYL